MSVDSVVKNNGQHELLIVENLFDWLTLELQWLQSRVAEMMSHVNSLDPHPQIIILAPNLPLDSLSNHTLFKAWRDYAHSSPTAWINVRVTFNGLPDTHDVVRLSSPRVLTLHFYSREFLNTGPEPLKRILQPHFHPDAGALNHWEENADHHDLLKLLAEGNLTVNNRHENDPTRITVLSRDKTAAAPSKDKTEGLKYKKRSFEVFDEKPVV